MNTNHSPTSALLGETLTTGSDVGVGVGVAVGGGSEMVNCTEMV